MENNYIHWSDYDALMKELDKAEKQKDFKKKRKLEKRIASLHQDGLLKQKKDN